MKTIKLKPKKRNPFAATITAAAFAKLSPINQRKAIAKDVLMRLDAAQLTPAAKVWVNTFKRHDELESRDLQEVLTRGESCMVCALGGAICGLASIEDKVELKQKVSWLGFTLPESEAVLGSKSSSLHRRLTRIFGNKQLALMENAFEDMEGALTIHDYITKDPVEANKTVDKVSYFVSRYPKAKDRFKAIWTQVAKTGEFKL